MKLMLLLSLILVGFLLSRYGLLKSRHTTWMSNWIIYIALPSIALVNIPGMHITTDLSAIIITPVAIFLFAQLLFRWLLRHWLEPDEALVLGIVAGLGNTSFLGFPVLSALYTTGVLGYAVVFDQVGFLLLATAAYALIISHHGSFSFTTSARRILTFPAFLALIIALVLPGDFIPTTATEVLGWSGATISPLAMLLIGYYLAHYFDLKISRPVMLGIGYKLLIAPVLAILLLAILPATTEMIHVTTVMEAAMPPMISVAILAMQYRIQEKLTAQLLCWGTLVSAISLTAWHLLLSWA